MKVAFVIDTSPLMQLRQSVYLPQTPKDHPKEESKRLADTSPG